MASCGVDGTMAICSVVGTGGKVAIYAAVAILMSTTLSSAGIVITIGLGFVLVVMLICIIHEGEKVYCDGRS